MEVEGPLPESHGEALAARVLHQSVSEPAGDDLLQSVPGVLEGRLLRGGEGGLVAQVDAGATAAAVAGDQRCQGKGNGGARRCEVGSRLGTHLLPWHSVRANTLAWRGLLVQRAPALGVGMASGTAGAPGSRLVARTSLERAPRSSDGDGSAGLPVSRDAAARALTCRTPCPAPTPGPCRSSPPHRSERQAMSALALYSATSRRSKACRRLLPVTITQSFCTRASGSSA